MPADERGRRSQPADDDRARWLELADAALRRAPSEEEIAETEILARKEQEKIKRRILEYLVNNKDCRVSKTQIFNYVYGLFSDDIDARR